MSKALLLDTCAALWVAEGSRMRPAALAAIETAAKNQAVHVSLFTGWEIALLAKRARITLAMPPLTWFDALLKQDGVQIALLTVEILMASHELPGEPPADPADRIIIATARAGKLTIVTRDKVILRYGGKGHVGVMAC